jgi:hypothetical protein
MPPDKRDRRMLSREKGHTHITNATSTMLKYTLDMTASLLKNVLHHAWDF